MKYNKTKVTPSFAVNEVVIIKNIIGEKSNLWVLTGNIWIDLNGRSDLTAANGFLLTENTIINLDTMGDISLISDVTGATAQIMEWSVS